MNSVLYCGLSFFFFSSRRRHTRFDCDWSSDVCSSDLVALLPGEADGLGVQRGAHLGEDVVADGGAVGEEGVARQVLDAVDLLQHLALLGLARRNVEQVGLVEPDHLARDGVALHGLAELARAQAVVFLPLPVHARMAAEGLDLGAAFGVEDLLPGHVHLAEVAHVQNSGLEQLADARRNAAVDRTAVGNRRLAALGRCGDRKSTRLNSSHSQISYAVFCLKKKKKKTT